MTTMETTARAHITHVQFHAILVLLDYLIANGNTAKNVRVLAKLMRRSLVGESPPADSLLAERSREATR